MSTGDPMVEEKLAQVPAILRELGIDAWLLFGRETHTIHDPCFDLVVGGNVTWPSAFVLTAQGDRIAIVGSLDKAAHVERGHYPEIIGYVGGIKDELNAVLKRLDPRRIAINYSMNDTLADGLTHGMYMILCNALSGTVYADGLESSERLVAALRGRKSASERARVREACQITCTIYENLTPKLKAGLTEKQVAALIREEMDRFPGIELAWDEDHCPAVFTGPESAGAHAGPTDRVIEPGHIVNTDFGIKKGGYCSDLQRTWYFLRPGETAPPEEVTRGFRTIVEAIEKAADALRPGVPAGTIDDVARGHIMGQGYPEYPHALGHQVGRSAHDGGALLCPRWERYGTLPDMPVEAGQLYTLEPRLPVPGHGIATIEEIVAVDAAGVEWLSRPQKELWLVK